jgi:hypothetical protein
MVSVLRGALQLHPNALADFRFSQDQVLQGSGATVRKIKTVAEISFVYDATVLALDSDKCRVRILLAARNEPSRLSKTFDGKQVRA